MFASNRPASAVLLPLALLLAVAFWVNRPAEPAVPHQVVAANLPSR